MPNFNLATITNKGLALMTKVTAGTGNIKFTKAATGAGEYSAGTDMAAVTALLDQRQEFEFSRKAIENETTVALRIVMTNDGVTEDYPVNEIGLFAEDPDEGEILYSIATAAQADIMPAYSESNPVTMTVESYVTVASADTVEVTIKQGASATQEDLEELEKKLQSSESNMQNKLYKLAEDVSEKLNAKANKSTEHTVTLPASGWTGAAAPYTITVDVPGVTATNDVSVFPKFDWTPEQAEAWAGAMVLSGDQAAGKLTLKAYGDKPVVDLAVTVLVGDEIKKGGN